MTKIIHKELSYTVRGVLLHVYNTLGPNLPERFYQDAIVIGLEKRSVRCSAEKAFEVYYRQERVGLYLVDIWIEACPEQGRKSGKIILELKVAPEILPIHKAQAISYLKTTDADLAIVVSFGGGLLLDERLPNFVRGKVVNFRWENRPVAEDLLYPELTNRLFEALHRVHFELGPGFFHQVYRRATMIELHHQGIPYEYIKQVPVYYGNHHLGDQPVRLIAVDRKVLVAAVAVQDLDQAMQEQLKARLRHLDYRLGLLANFHGTTLNIIPVRR